MVLFIRMVMELTELDATINCDANVPVSDTSVETMAHLELTPASRTRVVLWRAELAFLKRCRGLKRPPKTVRMPSKYLRGARSGVGNGRLQSFLKKVSDLESARLELAIVEKSNKIRDITTKNSSSSRDGKNSG